VHRHQLVCLHARRANRPLLGWDKHQVLPDPRGEAGDTRARDAAPNTAPDAAPNTTPDAAPDTAAARADVRGQVRRDAGPVLLDPAVRVR